MSEPNIPDGTEAEAIIASMPPEHREALRAYLETPAHVHIARWKKRIEEEKQAKKSLDALLSSDDE